MNQRDLEESWRRVPGYDGWYEVSTLGRIRSWRIPGKFDEWATSPRILTCKKNKGYVHVLLTHPVLGKMDVAVHHVVLSTFVGRRPTGHVCDHINALPSDNRVSNLRWVTWRDNSRHAFAMGRMNPTAAGRARAKLDESDVREIRRLRREGVNRPSVAAKFGISENSVWRIVSRRAWKDVE